MILSTTSFREVNPRSSVTIANILLHFERFEPNLTRTTHKISLERKRAEVREGQGGYNIKCQSRLLPRSRTRY